MTRTLAGLACVLLLWGCHKKPLPSPQFVEALGLYTSLVDSKGDDAWNDPEMDRVYTLCNSVNAKSSDFETARTLMARIDEERAKRTLAGTRPAPKPEPNEAPNWPDFPKPPEEVDAGPAAEPQIAGLEVGASFDTLRAKYGPCFEAMPTQIDVPGGSKADGYLWAGRTDCPKALAGAASKVILVQNGKILRVADKSLLEQRTFEVQSDGGATQIGGPPPPVVDAGPPAPPPAPLDAGAP